MATLPFSPAFHTVRRTFRRSILGSISLLTLFGAGSLSGCSTVVSGGGAGEAATIIPQGVRLRVVNGSEIGVFSSSVQVAPGPVKAEFDVEAANYLMPDRSHTSLAIRFNADPGVTYIITGRRGDSRLCAFPRQPDGQPDLTRPAGCIARE